jgi:hypothetical protein
VALQGLIHTGVVSSRVKATTPVAASAVRPFTKPHSTISAPKSGSTIRRSCPYTSLSAPAASAGTGGEAAALHTALRWQLHRCRRAAVPVPLAALRAAERQCARLHGVQPATRGGVGADARGGARAVAPLNSALNLGASAALTRMAGTAAGRRHPPCPDAAQLGPAMGSGGLQRVTWRTAIVSCPPGRTRRPVHQRPPPRLTLARVEAKGQDAGHGCVSLP